MKKKVLLQPLMVYIFVYTNAYDCLFDIFIFLTICFPTSQAKMTLF
ncbi:hypothetical protein, unlikely [Trypanosoma brucei brucei TREU927]|uniref:Uncharacterized protein n=1 Tax=Trypanosoma brucei brucei (strain 927/4 GUTat10.1) TaxID=185431 RepID=Q38EX0_TRYB2|nr:hypothetical protein, unlikely [Trypanosoma brucei brucei TREU927]EAN76650.1 hypothetical protein, unlikely [Trypanosoma brucei brucei TREU927]